MTPEPNREDNAVTSHLVRATQEPGVVREVSDAELLDLHRLGILHSYEHTDAASAVLGGSHVKTPGRWKSPEKGDDIVEAPVAMTEPADAADDTKGA